MIQANGRKKVTVYVRPDQYLWLRALSLEQVMVAGKGRPDVSRLIEGMLDFYRQSVARKTPAQRKR